MISVFISITIITAVKQSIFIVSLSIFKPRWWNKATISINGFPQFGEICERDTVVEIDVEIEDETENFLTIEYMNKDAKKDVVLGEDGVPVEDKRVDINSISFDDIELDFFQLTDPDTFNYEPIDPSGAAATGFDATKLAWNGKTTLRFTTPVYIWLLENL